MLSIKNIDNRQEWENFNQKFSPNSFLQSWNYGQFAKKTGNTPYCLGIYNHNHLIATGLFLYIKAKRGHHFTCAAGPLIKADMTPLQEELPLATHQEFYQMILKAFLDYLQGQETPATFIRIRPNLLQTPQNQLLYQELGFKPAPMHLNAEHTWVLDIDKPSPQLLKNMRKNTRYYIKKAKKEGVTIEISNDKSNLATLHQLQTETVQRQGFVPFSLSFFEKLFDSFITNNQVALLHAHYQEQIISSAMINFYGDTAVYHYAASSSDYLKVPSSYLLLWEAIQEAQKRGCRYFNFWGVVDDDQTSHPWHGLSRFKKGFGGQDYHYLHAQDLPLNKYYWLNWLIERWRKWRRGL